MPRPAIPSSAQWWIEHLWFAVGPVISLPFVWCDCDQAIVCRTDGTQAIVEEAACQMGEVAEAVPLGAALGVYVIDMIVRETFG
jgi:hypothetical protein